MVTTLLPYPFPQANGEVDLRLFFGQFASAAVCRSRPCKLVCELAPSSEQSGPIELERRRAQSIELRRRRMIRDTELYLNNPHSVAWARLSRTRTDALTRACA